MAKATVYGSKQLFDMKVNSLKDSLRKINNELKVRYEVGPGSNVAEHYRSIAKLTGRAYTITLELAASYEANRQWWESPTTEEAIEPEPAPAPEPVAVKEKVTGVDPLWEGDLSGPEKTIYVVVQKCEHSGDLMPACEFAKWHGRIVGMREQLEGHYETGVVEFATREPLRQIRIALEANGDLEGLAYVTTQKPDGYYA